MRDCAYSYTSDETKAVIEPNVKAFARAKGCSPGYIYKVLEGEKNDPYPPFRQWVLWAVAAGLDVRPWLNDLLAIEARGQTSGGSVHEEVAALVREAADVPVALLTDKPLEVQLIEAQQCLAQAKRTVQALAIELSRQGSNVRDITRPLAKGRR